ncbi:subtilase-type protease inhibitor [Dactylosporangium sp. NPDC006015]|uniref:subtilase-type protease inhibitor n=1 Tax=Dactylosporangium sp. NPDC006015 TaxID=3154576 RepID=UPI0033B9C0C7
MGAGRLVATATMLVAAIATVETMTAAAATAAPARPTKLVLTVAKGESSKPAQRRASLTCRPAGGSHKLAKDACSALAKVGGDFARLQATTGMACTMQYDPVTVTAVGRWKGKRVDYKKTYGNACSLSTTTGPVFSL